MNNILITYPKSASDWLRYSMEYIYLRPTSDEGAKPISKLDNMLKKIGKNNPVNVDKNGKPILIKKHYVNTTNKNDKIIFTYRDYKEIIFSFIYAQTQQKRPNKGLTMEMFVKNNYNNLDNHFVRWMNNFVSYYKHKGKKYIINYHNLIKNPEEEINGLMDFIGFTEEDKKRKEDFFSKLEEHKQNSIEYKKHPSHMPNNSFGTGQKYQESFLSKKQHDYIDNLIMSVNTEAFDYLKKIKNEGRHNTI